MHRNAHEIRFRSPSGGKAIHFTLFNFFTFGRFFFFRGRWCSRCTSWYRVSLVYIVSPRRDSVTSRMTRMIGRGVNYKLFSLVFNFVEPRRIEADKSARRDFSSLGGPFNIFPCLFRVTWDGSDSDLRSDERRRLTMNGAASTSDPIQSQLLHRSMNLWLQRHRDIPLWFSLSTQFIVNN